MNGCYLRIEGVNLGAVFDDSQQVSVIRGASFLLRQAARSLPEWLKDKDSRFILTPISIGASVGLYACDTDNPDALLVAVRRLLREREPYQHFTFVADTVAKSGDFPADLENLIAANRWQQMSLPSLSLVGLDAERKEPCSWNGIRPADDHSIKRDDKQLPISASVASRFDAGRTLRQTFYATEARDDTFETYRFTDDLNELAKRNDSETLANKIAVIYLDGNRFGTLQRDLCTKPDIQAEFDKYVQDCRSTYLANFLRHAHVSSDYLTSDGRLRLEVLMWGGDEILLVVPAWCGLDALTFFFDASRNWKFKDKPLTHAGGLVFANRKTPLSRLRDLAKNLAEGFKDQLRPGELHNGFDYIVLESIDYPTQPLHRFREQVFGAALASTHVPLKPMPRDAGGDVTALHTLPKGQCYALVRAVVKDGGIGRRAIDARDRLELVAGEDGASGARGKDLVDKTVDAARRLFASPWGLDWPITDAWLWLHMVDLWDYLPPSAQDVAPSEQQETRK